MHLCPLTPNRLGSSGLGHSEPFAVILSEAKDLALGAQGKLREESPSDFSSAIDAAQSEIPRFARNDSVLPFTPHPSAFTVHPWSLLLSLCRIRFV
jgi:hypothetical protein